MQQSYAGRIGKLMSRRSRRWGSTGRSGLVWVGAFAAAKYSWPLWVWSMALNRTPPRPASPFAKKLRQEKRPDGTPLYTPLVGLSLLLFFALACQCTSTLAAVRRETGSLRWPLFCSRTPRRWLGWSALPSIRRDACSVCETTVPADAAAPAAKTPYAWPSASDSCVKPSVREPAIPTVVVNARGRARIVSGHPWVFRQDVLSGPATDARQGGPALVAVLDERRRTLASATWAALSPVACACLNGEARARLCRS